MHDEGNDDNPNQVYTDYTCLSDIQPAGEDANAGTRGNHNSDEKSFLELSELESPQKK